MDAGNVFSVGNDSKTEIRSQGLNIGDEINMAEPQSQPQCSQMEAMEMETDEIGDSIPSNSNHHGNETVISSSPKVEGGSNGNVVFSREAPHVSREDLSISTCSCEAEKLKSRLTASDSEPGKNEKKLSR